MGLRNRGLCPRITAALQKLSNVDLRQILLATVLEILPQCIVESEGKSVLYTLRLDLILNALFSLVSLLFVMWPRFLQRSRSNFKSRPYLCTFTTLHVQMGRLSNISIFILRRDILRPCIYEYNIIASCIRMPQECKKKSSNYRSTRENSFFN